MFDDVVKQLNLGGFVAGVRQVDEQKVLEAVLDVFWSRGWQATSMADLAEAADVQRGSLYHAYGGKEALFLLAFELYAGRFLSEAKAALSAATAEQALRGFFKVAVANMTKGQPARGCLTTKTAAEVGAAGPRIQQRLRHLLDDLRDVFVTALAQPYIAKDLALPPEDAADILITFTRGLAVLERVYENAALLRRNADSLVRALVLTARP